MYAIPQHLNQVEYALDTAVKLLEFYQKYFFMKYPLEKLGKFFKTFILKNRRSSDLKNAWEFSFLKNILQFLNNLKN